MPDDFSDLGTAEPLDAAQALEAPAEPPADDIDTHVNALIQHESGGNPNAVGDSGLAVGLGQMHPEVRRAYGVTPRSTPDQQRNAVKAYFTDLWKKHQGRVDDVVSEYHLGATRYKKDRNSPDNLAYLDRYKKKLPGQTSAIGETPASDDFSDLGVETAPPDTQPVSDTETSPTPTSDTASGIASSVNKALGKPDDHPIGQYASDVLEPLSTAATDFVKGASNITHPTGFRDALNSFLELVHPLAVPGEVAGNVVFRAATDAGLSPEWASGLATAVNMGVGMLTPIPGGKAAPKMPLQGSGALRDAAAETAAAAERATAWAEHAKVAGKENVAAAGQTAETAAKEAERVAAEGKASVESAGTAAEAATAGAQTDAEATAAAANAAAEKIAPSTDAAARAREGLTPSGVTPEQGGQAIKEGLKGQLAEQKSAVGGIYDAYVAEHGADPVMDPASQRELSQMIDSASGDLGALWSGKPAEILDGLKTRIDDALKGQQPLNKSDLNEIKTQLDTLLRGGAKTQKNTLLNQINMKVRDLIRGGAAGEDADWLNAADHLWKTELAGREMTGTSLGKIVNLIKKSDPATVVEKLFGNGTSDTQAAMAKAVLRRLDSEGGAGEAIRQSVFARLFKTDADGKLDPEALLKAYDAWHPEFRSAVNTPGAETFFKVERQMQEEAAAAAARAKTAAKGVKETEKIGAKGVKEAEKGAAEKTSVATAAKTAAEKRAADVAKSAEKEAATTASVAEKAAKDAESAAEAAKAPNKLAKLTARGLKFSGIGLTEAVLHHLGVSPYIAGPAGAAELLIPTDHLAKLLANSKTANILARALKTPTNSAVVPALMQELRSSPLGKELLASPEGQQKQDEARGGLMAGVTP